MLTIAEAPPGVSGNMGTWPLTFCENGNKRKKLVTGNREQGTGNREQGTGNRETKAYFMEQGTIKSTKKLRKRKLKEIFFRNKGKWTTPFLGGPHNTARSRTIGTDDTSSQQIVPDKTMSVLGTDNFLLDTLHNIRFITRQLVCQF